MVTSWAINVKGCSVTSDIFNFFLRKNDIFFNCRLIAYRARKVKRNCIIIRSSQFLNFVSITVEFFTHIINILSLTFPSP